MDVNADGRPQKKSTSPWVYVGCGCGLLVVLAMAGLAGLTYWGYQKGKEFEQGFKDPQVREAKTRKVLPYRELPAGYHPAGAFSIPFFMDMAFLTDRELPPGEASLGDKELFGEHGFIFMNMRHVRDNKREMERYLRGEAPAPKNAGWNQPHVSFDAEEVIRRGTVSAGGRQILYAASRGEVSPQGQGSRHGIVTMVMPQCPDNRLRFGLWFGPDPAPDKPITEVDYSGTTADPAAIADFLGHFGLCGGK